MASLEKPPINVDYFADLTGDIDACDETCREQIGDRIKQLREDKGLSIEELARLTNFDEQLLRDIEDNTVSPQLGTIIKLSKAMDSALQRLIAAEGRMAYSVTRKNERKIVTRSSTSRGQRPAYTYMSLAPEVKDRHMEVLMVQLEELVDAEPSVHAGEEFIHVLEGTVLLRIGEERFELLPGDSAYYLSSTAHLLSAKEGRAKILAVIYSQ
ncbi:MAG: XRE family transcriptional regulator [Desulfatitalea sp. BRH_c12]|nr:MAG: XRE family transcriptional regulator [Desulfatitalea sp. BRH_c12]